MTSKQRIRDLTPIGTTSMMFWDSTVEAALPQIAGMGFDAVEIKLKSGKRFRIGTDEPGALIEAIRKRCPSCN